MRRLLLIRHAQSEWNAEGRWQGSADPDLSPAGRHQAAEAAGILVALLAGASPPGGPAVGPVVGPVVGLVSSDLRRAVHTAASLGAAVGWPSPPVQVPGIREHDVGEWSGLTRSEIEDRWPGMLASWSRDPGACAPGGESRTVFDARVRAAVGSLAASAPEGLTVGVTHGGVLRAVARWLGIDSRPMANLEGYLLDAGDGTPRHLGDVLLLAQRPPLGRDGPATAGVPGATTAPADPGDGDGDIA